METPQRFAPITAAIATFNRGEGIVVTVVSILANTHPDFSLLIVDQSTDTRTRDALAPFMADPRLRYVHTAQQGKSRASNLSLQMARTEIVAFTDDDCEVPTDWLTTLNLTFDRFPAVAVVFCNVTPAPYDEKLGFIPCYVRQQDYLVRSIKDKNRARGIGAGIAVRRLPVLEMGGYDEMLGPGAPFPDCDDGDLAVRALLKGH